MFCVLLVLLSRRDLHSRFGALSSFGIDLEAKLSFIIASSLHPAREKAGC